MAIPTATPDPAALRESHDDLFRPATVWPPTRLTVVYDDQCELCRRCRHWLATQPKLVDLQFLASSEPEAVRRYGNLPWYRIELMVIADNGVAWVGPEAFVMALWATRRYRPTSYRISGRAFRPLAERFFHTISANRSVVSGMLTPHRCESGSCSTAPVPPSHT